MTIDEATKETFKVTVAVEHESDTALTADYPIRQEAHDAYASHLRRRLDDLGDDLAIALDIRARDAADDGVRTSLEDFMDEQGYSPADL